MYRLDTLNEMITMSAVGVKSLYYTDIRSLIIYVEKSPPCFCQAGKKMQQQLEELQAQVSTAASSHQGYVEIQQNNKDKGDKVLTAAKSSAKKKSVVDVVESVGDEELSQAAKDARLRRVCERKPSGKIKVPLEVHEKWKSGNKEDRQHLMEILEEGNWSQDTPCMCMSPHYVQWMLSTSIPK